MHEKQRESNIAEMKLKKLSSQMFDDNARY